MASEHTVDVVVVGTGAGGLISALRASHHGLSVMVIEKSANLGGTSAMSGGGIWIPSNRYLKDIDVDDSKEEAFEYMRALIEDKVGDDKLKTYIDLGQPMLDFLMANTQVQYVPAPGYADYYPNIPGWKSGGRTMDPSPISGIPMGKMLYKMNEAPITSKAMGRINMSILEGMQILSTAPGYKKIQRGIFINYLLDIVGRLKGKRDRRLTQGNSLVGGLYLALRDRGIPIHLNSSAKDLITDNGQITGVVIERDGDTTHINVEKGVILAAGGFESNQEMREEFLPQPSQTDWTAAQHSNTGDMIKAGIEIGAATDFMEEAWWAPVVRVPGQKSAIALFNEKSKPGLVFVTKDGNRFMNEALPYNTYGEAMYGAYKAGEKCIPAYAVFDSRYRDNYMFGPILNRQYQPDWAIPSRLKKGFLKKADTLEELAKQLDINADGLVETAERMKKFAETGVDEDFHRGEDDHDRTYGDPKVTPNPCLGPLDKPPYYGVTIYPGELGTKGGLATDCDARVLNQAGDPIAGLYAIGNCSASMMGSKYPGAGTTLGPALIFGYAAANHLAGNQPN